MIRNEENRESVTQTSVKNVTVDSIKRTAALAP